MHFNSHGTAGFFWKISSCNNFDKSVVLILNYQMPFLQSGRFSDKMWTGAYQDLASLSSVLEVWNPSQNWRTHRHRICSWNIEMQSKSLARGCDGFCFEVCLNAVCLLHPSPIHLAWKSIIYLRKTATGSVITGKYFQHNC